MGILGSFVAGLGTGLKANVNGAAGAAASMATLGFVDQMEVWGVTDWDRSVGYDTAVGFAQAGYTILGGVATGGLACGGGKIAQAAKIYDLAGNIVGVGRGSADIYEDGLNFQNGVQVLGSSLGIAGNALSKCFTAGTQIVVGMEFDENDVFVQYVTVNIEDVRVGDLVYSYDTATGEVSQKAVTAVFVRESDHINYLTILDAHGNEQVIETTDGHPFWVVTDEPDLSRAARSVVDENGVWLYHENIGPTEHGFWVEAKDLRVGDIFLGANGELSTLANVVRIEQDGGITVFNFTVEGNHNYFILAKENAYGQSCVLVHNANYKILQGVHRSAAARDIGMKEIRANINLPDGKVIPNVQVPIKDLYSPRDALLPDRYLKTLEKMMASPETMPAIEVMELKIPKFVSIMDVHLP